MILIARQRSDVLLLKERLAQIFNKVPFFVDGQAMKLHAELGISYFPDNGKNLSQLIGTSLPKTTFETIMTP